MVDCFFGIYSIQQTDKMKSELEAFLKKVTNQFNFGGDFVMETSVHHIIEPLSGATFVHISSIPKYFKNGYESSTGATRVRKVAEKGYNL